MIANTTMMANMAVKATTAMSLFLTNNFVEVHN